MTTFAPPCIVVVRPLPVDIVGEGILLGCPVCSSVRSFVGSDVTTIAPERLLIKLTVGNIQ